MTVIDMLTLLRTRRREGYNDDDLIKIATRETQHHGFSMSYDSSLAVLNLTDGVVIVGCGDLVGVKGPRL